MKVETSDGWVDWFVECAGENKKENGNGIENANECATKLNSWSLDFMQLFEGVVRLYQTKMDSG